MSTSSSTSSSSYNEVYVWQEDVEQLERYRKGGYHPIIPGDEFCSGRYRIVHKVGHGEYSTVWLARDTIANQYVSFKATKASLYNNSTEKRILDHLSTQGAKQHSGSRYISPILKEISVNGPNGSHRCLIGEALGQSVNRLHDQLDDGILPLELARKTVAQLALGLAAVHSNGVVHGGKLFPFLSQHRLRLIL